MESQFTFFTSLSLSNPALIHTHITELPSSCLNFVVTPHTFFYSRLMSVMYEPIIAEDVFFELSYTILNDPIFFEIPFQEYSNSMLNLFEQELVKNGWTVFNLKGLNKIEAHICTLFSTALNTLRSTSYDIVLKIVCVDIQEFEVECYFDIKGTHIHLDTSHIKTIPEINSLLNTVIPSQKSDS